MAIVLCGQCQYLPLTVRELGTRLNQRHQVRGINPSPTLFSRQKKLESHRQNYPFVTVKPST